MTAIVGSVLGSVGSLISIVLIAVIVFCRLQSNKEKNKRKASESDQGQAVEEQRMVDYSAPAPVLPSDVLPEVDYNSPPATANYNSPRPTQNTAAPPNRRNEDSESTRDSDSVVLTPEGLETNGLVFTSIGDILDPEPQVVI